MSGKMFLHVHLVTIPEHESLRIHNNQLVCLPWKKGICKNDSASFFCKETGYDFEVNGMQNSPFSLCVQCLCPERVEIFPFLCQLQWLFSIVTNH